MKAAVPLSEALAIARGVAVSLLQDFPVGGNAAGAEPVGSIRRMRPVVGDVEVLAWGLPAAHVRRRLESAGIRRGPPNRAGARAPWGDRYFRGTVPGAEGPIQVDLFLCLPPAQLGVLRLIRTGSARFSQAVVTRLHRYGLRTEDGRVLRDDGAELGAPREEDVLRAARLPWIPPERREMDLPETVRAFSREAAPWECV